MNGLKILYVCNEDRATTKQRLMALKELQVDVDIVYTHLLNERIGLIKKIIRALSFRLGFFPERNNENAMLLRCLQEKKYDILFVEKGLSIKPATLRKAKKVQAGLRVVSYTLDDVMNKKNSSLYYRRSIPLYDFHFTNKKFNVPELESAGGRNVHYFKNGYSEQVHRPINVDDVERDHYGSDVSFIGTFEEERAASLRHIAEQGINVKVWGWVKTAAQTNMDQPNITMKEQYAYDDDYAKVICSSKINLCFLRKENRDTETTRSVEIPACGGFMLAERTNDHLELFDEDKEAAYFGSEAELVDKIKYYLQHETERKQIAQNALARCIKSEYGYTHQLRKIISIILGHDAFGDR